MHRVDTAGATQDNKFTDGDPAQGILATVVDAAILNAIQEELVYCIAQMGIALEKGNHTQLWQALLAKFAAIAALDAHAALTAPHSATSAATPLRLMLRDAGGRCKAAAGVANDDVAVVSQLAPAVPAGTVIHVAMAAAPAGYLAANGALVSRATYATLFAAIGTTWGAGDGSTTFALPDLRGEFLRGLDDGRGVDSGRALGTAQKGSFCGMGAGPTIDNTSPYTTSTGAAARGELGYDTPNLADYPTARLVAAGSPIGPYAPTDNEISYGTARPRNIALLTCIKY